MTCGNYGQMTAMMIGGWVFYLAFLVLAVLAIIWLVRALRRPTGTQTTFDDGKDN
jgi:hypothetical protein